MRLILLFLCREEIKFVHKYKPAQKTCILIIFHIDHYLREQSINPKVVERKKRRRRRRKQIVTVVRLCQKSEIDLFCRAYKPTNQPITIILCAFVILPFTIRNTIFNQPFFSRSYISM